MRGIKKYVDADYKLGEMLSNTVVNGYLVAFDGRVIY